MNIKTLTLLALVVFREYKKIHMNLVRRAGTDPGHFEGGPGDHVHLGSKTEGP